MNLKGLLQRELGEGLTEEELAATIGVSRETIDNILSDKTPKDIALWKKFATYFRMDVDFLRTGELPFPSTHVKLSEDDHHSSTIEMRKVPLLPWSQINRVAPNKGLSRIVHSDVMLEATDVPGKRTFALKVKDNSMQPLFSEGEIIFVNPDLKQNRAIMWCSETGGVVREPLWYDNSSSSGDSTSFTHSIGSMTTYR